MNDQLRQLLESGQFNWDNISHRQMFLREWSLGDPELRSAVTEDGESPEDQLSSSQE